MQEGTRVGRHMYFVVGVVLAFVFYLGSRCYSCEIVWLELWRGLWKVGCVQPFTKDYQRCKEIIPCITYIITGSTLTRNKGSKECQKKK